MDDDKPELNHPLIKRIGQQQRNARLRWLHRVGIAWCVVMGLTCYVGAGLVGKTFSVGFMMGSIPTAMFFWWMSLRMNKL